MFAIIKIIICSLMLTFGGDPKECDSMLKVKKVNTPIGQVELLDVLRESHVRVIGVEPNEKRVTMAWAQVAFENGRGKKVFNHNLGNIGTSTPPKNSYYVVSGYQFKDFSDFQEGADAYWRTMKRMCKGALPAFDAGDPTSASIALRRCGYYRADVGHYTKNLTSLYYQGIKISD